MASEYKSPFSVGKRQTMFLDANDPRIRGFKAGISAARSGSEIVVVNSQGASLRGSSYSASNNKTPGAPLTPQPQEGKTPGEITNLSAAWQELDGGPALVFSFDIDLTLPDNDTVDYFEYTISDGTTTTQPVSYSKLNTTSSAQQIIFYYADNTKYFGIFQTVFTEFKVRAHDKSGLLGPEATLTSIPSYSNSLPAPVITVTSIPMGYSVDWSPIAQTYQYISVEEVVSDAGTAPTTGYQQVYLNVHKPANIVTPTTDARWIKARFTDKAGTYGPYSNAVKVTPINPISVDLIPPSEIASVSAVWSGDNIVVSYTLPSTDAGVRFKIALTAPNSSVGYFYFFPVAGTLNQTAIISKADLFLQFGSHYSSYTGLIKSIDAADNQSSGVAFTVGARVNPLLGVTPTFTTTALVNGYNVSYTLPAGAVYAEVYQKYTSWSGVTPYDSFTGSYASGGASGTNTVTLSNVLSNKGVAVTPLIGFIVIGAGIPENTYITAVSGNQITVNNNFTSQVSGSITGYGIVYSGTSPANISSTLYQNTYLLVRYYDDFENPSNYSAEQIVVPLSPVTVDINGPGNVATVAASTSGIDTSGTLGFNGYINLNWTAVSDTTLRGYRIRFTTDTSNPVYSYVNFPIDQSNPPTGTISYKLIGLAVGATYKIGVATYDEYNNTSSAYTSFTDVTITGTPALSNYIESGTAGFQFGSGIKDKTGVQNASAQGIYLSNSNYWYLTSANSAQFKVGGPSANYLEWNGTKLTVDGDITAKGGSFAGNIALTTSGASIYSGDVTTSPGNLTGDGFIFNKDGLLIRKGSNQVSLDTTNGAITANAGNIADWVISASKIEKLDPTSTKYAGLSSTGLYKFWSGSTSAGGDETQFAVNRDGKLFAKSVQISGGTLDIGALPTNLTSGFHVLTDGTMYATGAQVNGAITATSGKITGNFQVESGSFYTGTSPTNTSVIINDKGLASIGATNNTLTAIVNTPISSGNIPLGDNPAVGALPTAITFFTKAALIGGWVVNDTSIRDRSEQFILHSTDKRISITGVIDVSTNYRVRFGTDLTGSGSGTVNIFEAGVDGQTPNFYITRGGILNATGAVINGNITATTMTSTGNFSFAGGILQGTTNSLTLNGANFILTDTSGGDDGTAGDPTVTRIINPAAVGGVPDGKIVTGRAIWYGGNNTPTSAITSRYAFNNTFGGSQGYVGGVPRYTSSNPGNFATGDLYMTIV
jgi:hypothetical protein